MGTLLRRCVEVHIAIELSFGMVGGEGSVSGMVSGIIRHLDMHWFQ